VTVVHAVNVSTTRRRVELSCVAINTPSRADVMSNRGNINLHAVIHVADTEYQPVIMTVRQAVESPGSKATCKSDCCAPYSITRTLHATSWAGPHHSKSMR